MSSENQQVSASGRNSQTVSAPDAELHQPLVELTVASVAQLKDADIAEMSRIDLMDVLRLSGQQFSTLDETQQLYAPLDRLQFFCRMARDLCRQCIATSQPRYPK